MARRKEYVSVSKSLQGGKNGDIAEISIYFYDVPMEKRSQIESAANELLDQVEKILATD